MKADYNIDTLQYTLNALLRKRLKARELKDAAFLKYESDPTDENLQAFDELRIQYRKITDSISRTKNKLARAKGGR